MILFFSFAFVFSFGHEVTHVFQLTENETLNEVCIIGYYPTNTSGGIATGWVEYYSPTKETHDELVPSIIGGLFVALAVIACIFIPMD